MPTLLMFSSRFCAVTTSSPTVTSLPVASAVAAAAAVAALAGADCIEKRAATAAAPNSASLLRDKAFPPGLTPNLFGARFLQAGGKVDRAAPRSFAAMGGCVAPIPRRPPSPGENRSRYRNMSSYAHRSDVVWPLKLRD